MRWSLQADGDAPEDAHRDLAEKLGKLLSQAKFGTAATHFGSEVVNGPIHQAAAKPDGGEGEGM